MSCLIRFPGRITGGIPNWVPPDYSDHPDLYTYIARDPEEFYAELQFLDFSRGRSSCFAIWQVLKGPYNKITNDSITMPMFMVDLANILVAENIYKGVLSGTFIATKRGQNYGIRLVSPAPRKDWGFNVRENY